MRVTKNADGQFRVEDAPMSLEGVAAKRFLASIDRGSVDNTPERAQFLADCDEAYRKAKRSE